MIRIRDYTGTDLAGVLAVFQRSVREIASRDYTPAQIAAWAPDPPDHVAWAQRLSGGGVFIAETGERMAGFGRVDDRGCIDLLYVAPEHQGRGVARALLQRATAWSVSRGIARLSAEVSITARPFFERAGFSVIEPQTIERAGVRLRNFRMDAHIAAAGPSLSRRPTP
jgi:putative acetyltransferase